MSSHGPPNSPNDETCKVADNTTYFTALCVECLAILSLSMLVHSFIGRYSLPRIISEFIVGVIVGNVPVLRTVLEMHLKSVFMAMESFSSALYMFVLGLEMEPLTVVRPKGPDAKIAFAGGMATFVGAFFVGIVVKSVEAGQAEMLSREESPVMLAFVIVFSAASSPIITRLVTDLKLGQTIIGRRAIRAGLANDMGCMVCMCVLTVLRKTMKEAVRIMVFLGTEAIAISVLGRYALKWLNRRNHDGRSLKGVDMAVIVVTTQMMCQSSAFVDYDTKLNAFLVGLLLPRKGIVSNVLIGKINYYLTTFVLPLYLPMCGLTFTSGGPVTGKVMWKHMLVLAVITTLSKLAATLAAGHFYGLHWLEAVTLCMFLSMKGHFQIFFTVHARLKGLMNQSGLLTMIFIVISSIVYVPFAANHIIKKVRVIKGVRPRFMGLQWYNPSSELRVTIGLPGPKQVAPSMTLVEMMRAGSNVGTVVYAMDMIELSDENKAAIIYRLGTDSVMVADNEVIELREEIKSALDSHIAANGGSEEVKMNRIVAMSSFADMHDDICCSAQDTLAIIVVLPFHRPPKGDGQLDEGHPGFRIVNQNVILHSPCSVGILVDRGLGGHSGDLLMPEATMNVIVLFIGGADDREALACAGIMAEHPNIKLLALRIIPDKDAIAVEGPGRRILASMPQREKEMRMDDEYFAGFYEHYITTGRVGYMEKHMRNGAETVRMLRELDEEYQLFIVGQGSERNSILTAGLSEWAEYPELGPIGDILADPEFPAPSSVLVVKQHDPSKNSRYITDEFMPL